ncbi:MAG: hypothetical protein ACYCVH_01925 [Ignavibacteriaceae bacterium]
MNKNLALIFFIMTFSLISGCKKADSTSKIFVLKKGLLYRQGSDTVKRLNRIMIYLNTLLTELKKGKRKLRKD